MEKAISKINQLRHKLNSWIFYAVIALSVFIPLYPKFPLAEVSGTYVAIRLEDVLLLLLILFWGIINISKLKKILKLTITQSFLLFWFIGAASVISGIILTGTVEPNLGFLHFIRRIEYMLPFLVAATTIQNVKQAKIFVYMMFATAAVVALYGFGQIYFEFPVISTTNREFSKGQILTLTPGARPNSTFAGHYDLAAYLSLVLVFAGAMFFYYKSLRAKAFVIGTSLVSFALLGFTAARVSFVATLAGVALSFLLMKKKFLIILLIIASVVAVAAIPQLRHRLVATITVNLMEGGGPKYEPPANVVNEFTPFIRRSGDSTDSAVPNPAATKSADLNEATPSTQSAWNRGVPADIAPGEPTNITELGVYRSFNIRYDVEWPRAIRAFEKNPLLGTGYSSITIATDNDYLRALGETGILGFLSFALVFFIVTKKLIKAWFKLEGFEKSFIIASLCCILVILSTAVFIDILEASKIAILFWIILGIAWGIAGKYEDSN
jgi:hypothetical protein